MDGNSFLNFLGFSERDADIEDDEKEPTIVNSYEQEETVETIESDVLSLLGFI